MHWRRELFGSNQEAARKAFLNYVDSVMSSSYLKNKEMAVDDDCCNKCESNGNATMEQCVASSISEHVGGDGDGHVDIGPCTVHDKFVDIDVGGALEQEQLQRIRNTRSKHEKDKIQGKIIDCRECGETFSTNELVQMSLRHYKRVAEADMEASRRLTDDVTIHMSSHRRDIACYRFPYDFESFSPSVESTSFYETSQVRGILLRWRFDDHDFGHRPGCFKKGPECRFNLAKPYCEQTTLHVDEVAEDRSNVVMWHLLNESVQLETTPYLIETRRSMGSQFMNTHSVEASAVFACNTNVQMGEPCHLFYASAYAFKDTQSEDSERFIRIGTQVIKRLLRMQQAAAENARLENREPAERVPDFGGGLSMLLSGMCANLNKAICSATMAHLLINKEQRFEYSHQFTNVLVGQMEDVLDGKEGHFRIRKNHSKTQNTTVLWPDSSVDDYIHRPDHLGDISLYEFNANYKKVCKSFKQMKSTNASSSTLDDEAMEGNEDDSDNDDEEDDGENDSRKYKFRSEHPGHEFSYVQERKHMCIPVISLPDEEGLCSVKDLQIDSTNPSTSVIQRRERYAKLSLILFCPFRSLEDLQSENGNYWSTFESILAQTRIDSDSAMDAESMLVDTLPFYRHGIDILHNIDERKAIQTMRSAVEPIAKRTVYQLNEEDDDVTRRNRNGEDDSNAIDLAHFDEEEDRDVNADFGVAGENTQRTQRSNHAIIARGGVSDDSVIGARISHQESLLVGGEDANGTTATAIPQEERSASNADGDQLYGARTSFSQMIQIIEGTIVGGNYDDYTRTLSDEGGEHVAADMDAHASDNIFDDQVEQSLNIPTLQSVALKVAREEGTQLDRKQYIAYEILASTLLLDLLEDTKMTTTTLQLGGDARTQRIMQRLRALGGRDQLVMFLTGFAGAGKSTCIKVAQRYCFEFCRAASIVWDDVTFLFTSTTGSSASLFGGNTIHNEAFLNGRIRNISQALRERWKKVRLLIIDEISFFTNEGIDKLNKKLQNLLGVSNKPFGGMSVVFSGDFHQLKPVLTRNDSVLYDQSRNGLFLGSINCAIILEESHRFDGDPEYGRVMRNFWQGNPTVQDVDYINEREVGQNGVELPEEEPDSDITYACPFNKQRNAISAGMFSKHIQSGGFPTVDMDDLPPDHTIIVEADIGSSSTAGNDGVTRVSPVVRDAILQHCGDADVTVGTSRKVDPSLKLYNGAHVMCNNNNMLKTHNIGNGTIARVKSIKLKSTAPNPIWKNWEGYKVLTVNARHVEYVEIERFPDNAKIAAIKKSIHELEADMIPDDDMSNTGADADRLAGLKHDLVAAQNAQCVKVLPTKSTAKVTVDLTGLGLTRQVIKGVKIQQLPLIMNDATTGHKLQGMSKDKLVVVDWDFKNANWVYVVLSRVRTRDGLYLLKPLPRDCLDKFQVPRELIAFEQTMRRLEEHNLTERVEMMAELG